jgi:hypothetical protein
MSSRLFRVLLVLAMVITVAALATEPLPYCSVEGQTHCREFNSPMVVPG